MIYTFDEYELDTDRYELRRQGQLVPLRPQAFNVLLYLIRQRHRLVAKQELVERLWGGRCISDAALERCIASIRKALGDSGRTQRRLQTQYRRGYRFIASVVERDPVATTETPLLSPATSPPVRAPVAPPAPAARPLHVERKPVTVLSCRVTNLTSQPWHDDPVARSAVLSAFWSTALRVVEQYGGTVDTMGDDSFVALFGVPVAYEDHAWRALLVAHRLPQALQQAAETRLTALSLGMGIHSGTVIAWYVGNDVRVSPAEAENAVALACRLQQVAAPRCLLLSEATRRLLRDAMPLQKQGMLQVAGHDEPLAVYTILTEPTGAEAPSLGPRPRCFVGRARELALLHERFCQAQAGQGQVVALVGEAGIGKSCLLAEFHRRVSAECCTFLEGYGLSYGITQPYGPVRALLWQACGLSPAEGADTLIAKLRRRLRSLALDTEQAVAVCLRLLDLSPAADGLETLTPAALQARFLEVLGQLWVRLSEERPLVVVLENLHWIDQASQAWLAALVERVAGAAILLLLTYRPGYHAPWLTKSYVTQIALRPLGSAESLALVHAIVPPVRLPASVAQQILQRAEGHPFFLEELARAAAEQGLESGTFTVPATIQDVIMARLDQLPPAAKRLLQTASVLGRRFSQGLLEALWEEPEGVGPLLGELQRHEMLYEQREAGESLHVFKHALIQEVSYHSLPLARRQALHAAAGAALERRHAGRLEAVYAQLAYHYARTEVAAKAVEYLHVVAKKALRSHAHHEALAALREAAEHAARLSPPERDHCLVTLALAEAFSLSVLGRFREVQACLQRHHERIERLQEAALTGPYYFRLGLTALYLGEVAQVVPYAQRALAAARRVQDRVTLGQAYYCLALHYYLSGDFAQGMAYGRQAIAALQETGEQHWLGLAYWVLGYSAALLGEVKAALDAQAQAHAIGVATEDRRLQSFADGVRGWVLALCGATQESLAACRRGYAHAADPVSKGLAAGFLGCAYLEAGEAASALPLLHEAVTHFTSQQFAQGQARFMPFLAQAHLQVGAVAEARVWARRAMAVSRSVAYWHGIGWAARVLGRLERLQGRFAEAAHHFQEALEIFTARQARYEMACVRLELAALAQGDEVAVRDHLRAAAVLLRAMGMPSPRRRLRQLAQSYGVSVL